MNINKLKNLNAIEILFNWENLTFDDLKELSAELSIKMLRWLAKIHPDNKTRENLLRLSKLNIGKMTVINIGINIYSNEEYVVDIGSRCAIAADVSFIYESGPNFSYLGNLDYVKKRYIKKGKIIVADDVWIGHGAVIFPGVIIGKSSIIGAGSIVTKDVEPYSVVKGIPAVKVRDLKKENC